MLFNELTCMKKLRHPNVALLLGISIDNQENLYIVLELFEQQTLDKFVMKYKGEIPKETKFEILFDIAKALNYIHSNKPKIIHRDIKPENIFITSDIKAKVGDFGMSQITEINERHNTETTGTQQYMAPESLSKSIYSSASDIYGFGIVMWEMLMEKEAFKGVEGFALIQTVVGGNRPKIDKLDVVIFFWFI